VKKWIKKRVNKVTMAEAAVEAAAAGVEVAKAALDARAVAVVAEARSN